VISTAGVLAAGKGTFGLLAQEHGFTNVSTGELIRRELGHMDELEPSRDRQLEWGDARRSAVGPGYWVERALRSVEGDIVIDGIRSMGELAAVRQADGILVWFEAPLELSYRWSQGRKEERDRVTLLNFIRQQDAEFGEGQVRRPDQSHLSALRTVADFVITNDVDDPAKAMFYSKIRVFLESVRQQSLGLTPVPS